MAISIGASLALHSRLPLDDRTIMATIEEMRDYPENFLPDVAYCFVKADGKMYTFNRDNDIDPVLGKWRKQESGTGDDSISESIEVATNVGLIKEGTVFSAGTSVEDILKELFNGKEIQSTELYFGLSDNTSISDLTGLIESNSLVCTVNPNNQYVVFAAKEGFGDFSIMSNGFNYSNDFTKSQLIIDDVTYDVFISKNKITATEGFTYQLLLK